MAPSYMALSTCLSPFSSSSHDFESFGSRIHPPPSAISRGSPPAGRRSRPKRGPWKGLSRGTNRSAGVCKEVQDIRSKCPSSPVQVGLGASWRPGKWSTNWASPQCTKDCFAYADMSVKCVIQRDGRYIIASSHEGVGSDRCGRIGFTKQGAAEWSCRQHGRRPCGRRWGRTEVTSVRR